MCEAQEDGRGHDIQSCVHFIYCMIAHAHFLLCGGCKCEHALRIDLVLSKIGMPLVFKGLTPWACA